MYNIILINFLFLTIIFTMSLLTISAMSPLVTIMLFFCSVICCTYLFQMNLSSYMAYMLFLIYVGGMLVLLIYVVMLSSNYLFDSSFNSFVISTVSVLMFLSSYSYWFDFNLFSSLQGLESLSSYYINFGSLVMAGLFLLLMFYHICVIICMGGRSLEIGSKT